MQSLRLTNNNFSQLLRGLLVGLVMLGIFAMIILGVKSWQNEREDMQRNLAIQAGFAAKNSQALFDNIGASMEILDQLLVKFDVVNSPESSRFILKRFKLSHPEIIDVLLINPSGKAFLSSENSADEILPDFRSDPLYWRDFLFDMNNNYSYNIGRGQIGMGVQILNFPIRHTVQNVHGNPMYVIQASILLKTADLLWSDLPLYPGSQVGMIRSDGYLQMVWPSSQNTDLYKFVQSGALMATMLANPGLISGLYDGKSSIDDTERLGAFSHLPNANMSAFVSVPKRLLLFRWWEHSYPILLSFLVYLGIVSIISIRLTAREKQHTNDLLTQSRQDNLTGLPNRIAMDEILVRELSRARRYGDVSALLYLDLDKFKEVNDKLGHVNGDRLLERVVARLRSIMRAEDVLARIGGDEFLLLLPNADAEKSGKLAQRVLDEFVTLFSVSGENIEISASIGICVFSDTDMIASELLNKSDAAMFEAKRQGGGKFVFYRDELGESIHQRLQLKHDFLRALRLHEFFLTYQPLIDLFNGEIVGAEALVRWNDPNIGLRYPAEFIPFAEESGVILLLGEWVLKAACLQAKLWEDQGFKGLHVAVNLSARQFQDRNLFLKIQNALTEANLSPTKLELEITESASMQDPEESIQVMSQLKSIGIKIAIDDFGTGYSSLSYLKRIPADIIKIDRSFVQAIQEDPNDLAIVSAILALGKALDKQCLAEGIETMEQWSSLNQLGCHFGQGYFMSKPILDVEFIALLKSKKSFFKQP